MDCGLEVEYESHKFSDGFVYYLPRNLDKTIHRCLIVDLQETLFGDPDPDLEQIYSENKDRLKITQEKFIEIMTDQYNDPIDFLENGLEDAMTMLRKGKMYELKKNFENQINTVPIPYWKSRFPLAANYDDLDIAAGPDSLFTTKRGWVIITKTVNEICNLISPLIPTGNGYQLEILGYLYELMIRLEDAKKCYNLQYMCTKESELLGRSKELDKKIQEMNETRKFAENIPDDLTPEDMLKIVYSTELNIKKFIVELFSNNFTELFEKNPDLKEQTQKIRKKDEDTMLNFDDSSEIGTVSLGTLGYILKKSRGTEMAECDETCKICGIYWKKKDWIFSENIPKKISCVDKTCFLKQGGLSKNVKIDMIHRISNINKIRNILSHPRKPDQEMLKKYLMEAYVTCDILNHYIEDELKNKQFA
jgi:hypothetical protein